MLSKLARIFALAALCAAANAPARAQGAITSGGVVNDSTPPAAADQKSNGSTTTRHDSDNDGVGVAGILARDGAPAARANKDAGMTIPDLLAGTPFASQSFASQSLTASSEFLTDPSFWKYEKHALNPLFKVASNPGGVPGETTEQYTCAPVHLGGSTIVAYCKGSFKIYAHVSNDDGATWAVANGGAAVIAPTLAWEGLYTIEPEAMVDGSTIRLWYRGQSGIGYATASTASPYSFTKRAEGPVLTNDAIGAALGITVGQSGVGTVTRIGSTYFFYLYVTNNAPFGSQTFRLAYATGSEPDNPVVQAAYLTCGTSRICAGPHVFQPAGSPLFFQFYVEGSYNQSAAVGDFRHIVSMASRDGINWVREPGVGVVLSPAGGNSFDARQTHFARFLRKPDGAGLEPMMIDDRFQLYYSGQNAGGNISQGGIAYVTPVMGRVPALNFSGAESNTPRIRFSNSHGLLADGYISSADDANGTYPYMGSNLFIADNGVLARGDASRPGSLVRAAPGEVNIANVGGIATLSFTSQDSIAPPNIQGLAYDLHLSANARFNGTNWNRVDLLSPRPAYNIALNPDAVRDAMHFRRAPSGTGGITWSTLLKLDPAGVDQTPAWLLINGTLKRVVVGPPNSGGSGYRVLRVLN